MPKKRIRALKAAELEKASGEDRNERSDRSTEVTKSVTRRPPVADAEATQVVTQGDRYPVQGVVASPRPSPEQTVLAGSVVTDDEEITRRAGSDRFDAHNYSPGDEVSLDEQLQNGFVLRERFEIVEQVHSGGMGFVYKAIDRRRQEAGAENFFVAIKTTRLSSADQHTSQMSLEREAAKAQTLSHPNVVNVYDFDRSSGQFFIVMEWLDGVPLIEVLQRARGQRLAPAFAWHVVQCIARALQHAHLHNVIHADVKPSNIFITDLQEIKLLDFGIATFAGAKPQSDESPLWTTPRYASPEILDGQVPTAADDIFALGCTAYMLLGGAHPFDHRDPREAKREGVEPPPIPGLSPRFWQPVINSLAYARADRPSTAIVFLDGFSRKPEKIAAEISSVPQRGQSTTEYWYTQASARAGSGSDDIGAEAGGSSSDAPVFGDQPVSPIDQGLTDGETATNATASVVASAEESGESWADLQARGRIEYIESRASRSKPPPRRRRLLLVVGAVVVGGWVVWQSGLLA